MVSVNKVLCHYFFEIKFQKMAKPLEQLLRWTIHYYEFFSNNTEACTTILYKPTYVASSNVADFLYGWEDVECGVARGYICRYPAGSLAFS